MKTYRWFFLATVLIALSVPASARHLPDFVPLAEKYSPAVVNISSSRERTVSEREALPDLPEGTPFRRSVRALFRRAWGAPRTGAL